MYNLLISWLSAASGCAVILPVSPGMGEVTAHMAGHVSGRTDLRGHIYRNFLIKKNSQLDNGRC